METTLIEDGTAISSERRKQLFPGVAALTLLTAACGGSGGNGGVASAPSPVLNPSAATLPKTENPLAVPGEFATYGFAAMGSDGAVSRADVRFRYSAQSQAYEITLPGYAEGKLVAAGVPGRYLVVPGSGSSQPEPVAVFPNVPANAGAASSSVVQLTYTSVGHWFPSNIGPEQETKGIFIYGIPTAANEVPRTGAGNYTAQVHGLADAASIGGEARLNFDFGSGGLSGYMDPVLRNDTGFGEDEPLGRFAFAQTSHEVGSANFSGKFILPNGAAAAGSFFEGRFTGPGASEFMAQWQTPFAMPSSNLPMSTMSGVWLGKRD